jgi:hypothetical protein
LQFYSDYFYIIFAELRCTHEHRESNSFVPWAVVPGAFLYSFPSSPKGCAMADHSSPIQFEDVPLEEARRMGRGPRMDPELYHAFREKIQSLDSTATRIALPEGTSPTTMKNRIVRIATELGIPVTIRKVPGGLLFWRSTDEDVQQAKEVAGRLQTAQRGRRARQGRRRRV